MSGAIDDVRLAIRSLRGAPAVTFAAVLTLALGTGATSAIFSVVNALILRPLPVADPQELVTITSAFALRYGFRGGAGWNYPMWERLQEHADRFNGAFAWTLRQLDLSDGGEKQPVNALVASGAFFDVLGVEAAPGRTFTPADDRRGGGADGAVAVISEDFWERRLGRRNDVLGTPLRIEGVPVTIVGVISKRFRGIDVGQPFDVAMPFATEAAVSGPRSLMDSERALLLTVMLRLQPEQSIAEATAVLRALQPAIVGPGAPPFLHDPYMLLDGSRGISDRSRLRQQYQRPLLILSLVCAIALVLVCLNIANLLLSRALARRIELSVRLALGATRWRLVQLCLVEALVLGIAGSIGGMLCGRFASRALVAQLPPAGRPVFVDLTTDWRIVAFTVSVTVFVIVLCGTVPAVYAARVPPVVGLRHGDRGGVRAQAGMLSGSLVVMQVALSIVLLAAAGLFVRTMSRLASVPLGFEPKEVLVASIDTSRALTDASVAAQVRERMLEAIRGIAGVSSAGASVWTPLDAGGGLLTDARGRRAEVPTRADASQRVAFNFVTPGWFATYRTRITLGRDFDATDDEHAPPVAIINNTLSRTLFPGGQPLGRAIHAGPCGRRECTVVGVVADAIYGGSLRDAPPPTVYIPLAQSSGHAPPSAALRISIRTSSDSAAVTPAIATTLRGVDARIRFTVKRLEEDLHASMAQERLLAILSAFFGIVALALASIGLYGLSAYETARRRTEIAIRLALGAQPHLVLCQTLHRIAVLIATGDIAGVVTALWLSRFVAPLMFGLEAQNPATLIGSLAILGAVAALAAGLPAWRAVRLEPARVLREG